MRPLAPLALALLLTACGDGESLLPPDARLSSMKELPTLAESGLPNFEVAVWHGMYAPKGTPKPIVDTLASALQTALKDPNVKQRFADLGTEPVTEKRATPEALRAHVKSEIERWAPIITKAGVYAD